MKTTVKFIVLLVAFLAALLTYTPAQAAEGDTDICIEDSDGECVPPTTSCVGVEDSDGECVPTDDPCIEGTVEGEECPPPNTTSPCVEGSVEDSDGECVPSNECVEGSDNPCVPITTTPCVEGTIEGTDGVCVISEGEPPVDSDGDPVEGDVVSTTVVAVGQPPVPTVNVQAERVVNAQPIQTLPETGASFTLGMIFLAIAFISGGYLLWTWARDNNDIPDPEENSGDYR